MTVSSQETVFQYVGNGVTTTFAYSCQVPTETDLVVYLNDVEQTSGYTTTGIGSLTGGTVIFSAAPANGVAVRIEREIELERTTDYQQNGDFLAGVVNPDFDRLWMALQGHLSSLKRALKVPKTDTLAPQDLPPAAQRANNLLSFDANGQPVVVAPAAQSATALQILLASSIGSSLIGFIQAGIGAIVRTIQDRLRETVSVRDFGVVGDGSDEYINIKKAWDYCVGVGKDLYFPAGTYSAGANNMPFKHPDFPATSLLDCRNITIRGDGPDTVLKTVSANGADVLNVYSCKNLHFRNLKVIAELTGSLGSGSNGISVVGGFDNVTFDGVWCNDLPYVDKGTYLDGGKALTIQPGTPATECGTLKATRIYAKGCVYGAGLEVDLVNWSAKKHSIDIDIVAEDCHQGVIFSAGAATGALNAGITMGYSVRAKLVNCQRSVMVNRAHGLKIDAEIVTTKSAGARRLNPSGGAWSSTVTTVDAFQCAYAKNSRISVTGDVGSCDYKVQIGGATAGSSGLVGTTEKCDFFFDLGGAAGTSDFNLVDSGGNTMSNCRLYASAGTFASIPNAAYAPALNNVLTLGPSPRLMGITTAGQLWFAGSDGISVFQKIMVGNSGLRLDFSSSGSSSASNINYGFLKHDGTLLVGFRNDGTLVVQGRNTAASVATLKQVIPIYDNTNTLVGYVPIYTSFA